MDNVYTDNKGYIGKLIVIGDDKPITDDDKYQILDLFKELNVGILQFERLREVIDPAYIIKKQSD